MGEYPEDGYVPLHKLSQWLTYSLIEPLENAEIIVSDMHELTGLAEYRNGGLFVDMEVLIPRCLTEGGTWAAGRLIARQMRADGGPPFHVSSDGTVF